MKNIFLPLALLILIVSPTQAEPLAQLRQVAGMPGGMEQSVLMNSHLYASTTGGLLVLDVSDPAEAVQVAYLPLPGWSRGIDAEDGFVYLLAWDYGLQVIDVHNPSDPQVVAGCPEPTKPSGVVLHEKHLYISDMDLGLCVVDVETPYQPQWLANRPLPGEVYGLDVQDDVAYVASDIAGLHLLDISTPTAPTMISTLNGLGYVRDVDVYGDRAYLACGSNGLRVIDVSDPESPTAVGQTNMVFDLGYSAWTTSVTVSGQYALMGVLHHGLGVVDISDPTLPDDVLLQEVRGTTLATELGPDVAYVSASHGGMVTLDISHLPQPEQLSQFWLPGMVTDLEVTDKKVWLAGGYNPPDEKNLRTDDGGLFVVDMNEWSSPRVMGFCSTHEEPKYLSVEENHAYLSASYGGIRIQDISDASEPYEVGSIPTTAEGYAHAVNGDQLYTFQGNRFVVTDVSDPAEPREMGSCEVSYFGHLEADGPAVYNTVSHLGLQVFDVSDPTSPSVTSWLDLPNGAGECEVMGSYLYVANGYNGLTVVDVSNPASPMVAGSCELPGYVEAVACRGIFAYLVSADHMNDRGGVAVVNITNPSHPLHVGWGEAHTRPRAVAVDGPLVTLGCGWGGILAFEHGGMSAVPLPTPDPEARLQNHPNPFNPQTLITYEVAAASRVKVSVYDVAGRLVRSLVDEPRDVGVFQVPWDGLDNGGRAVGSGVYLARMTVGRETSSCTMVLAR